MYVLQGVDADAMAVLLHSVCRKEVDILKSNDILSVLQASSMLQFESIQKTCVEMIVHQWLTVSTCLQTMVTAEELDLITLRHKAQALALWEFSQVKETDAFLELPIGYVEKFLGNNGLNVTEGEFEVFEAGLCWLQDKPEERKDCLLRILNCVRFADIPLSDIKTILLYPLISENREYVQIVECIICIREGKNPEELCIAEYDLQAQTTQDSVEADGEILLEEEENSVSKQKNSKQCKCASKKAKVQLRDETVKVLNNCCCCCTSVEEATTPVEDGELIVGATDTSHEKDQIQFSTATVAIARQLLSTSSRTLPLLPCVVGHKRDWPGFRHRDLAGDNEGEKVSVGDNKPYLIYFQEGKTQHPVPFLHLSKANEGLFEPTGYKVICKGMCLHKL